MAGGQILKWLIDTNVISESTKARPHEPVLAWIADQAAEDMAISIVTLTELRDGAEIAPTSERRASLLDWLARDVEPGFRDRILPITVDILTDWLRLARRLAAVRQSRFATDLLIAATARVHGLVVVTRNSQDFTQTGVSIFNPWTGQAH
jgi:predicted nucleic acid-binding protein